jgi:hypothetical protein
MDHLSINSFCNVIFKLYRARDMPVAGSLYKLQVCSMPGCFLK